MYDFEEFHIDLYHAKLQWLASGQAVADMYYNKFMYDANGNITQQVRKDSTGTAINDLTYNYHTDGTDKKKPIVWCK